MSDSEQESSDEDLIREILDLRPDELRAESTAEGIGAQDKFDDPFEAVETPLDPGAIPSKKRSRRLDSDDDSTAENQLERRKGRIGILSDEEDEDEHADLDDNDSRVNDENCDRLRAKASKRRRPIISDDSDIEKTDRKDCASWQSSVAGSGSVKHETQKNLKLVKKRPEPSTPGPDSDESDIDQIILKKHCSSTGRRQKYASKPNPTFLDNLLRNITERSFKLRLGSGSPASKDNCLEKSPAININDKTDNDSIELEFSDEEECKIYGQQFQCRNDEKSNRHGFKDHLFNITADPPLPASASQKIQVRTQSVCGLYQNVGGQSRRQTMLKGLKKESRIRRMNSLCTDNIA